MRTPVWCAAAALVLFGCTSAPRAADEDEGANASPGVTPAAIVLATPATAEPLLPPPPPPDRCSPEVPAVASDDVPSPNARGVVLVSVDALATRHLEDLMARGMVPTFARLVDEGASTYNARCEARISVTIPNHTSMLSGRPAVAVPGYPADTHHGVLYNTDPDDTTILHGENPDLPYLTSVFDEVHDRGGYTGLFTGKDKFALFQRTWSAPYGRPDVIDADDGIDKLDDFEVVFDASELVPEFLSALSAGALAKPDHPLFALFHFRDTDALGHSSGWESEEYVSALLRVDELLGQILDELGNNPTLADMVLIVTTDHGAAALDHNDFTDPFNYRIPFFVWGAGIPEGVDLYRASAGTRVDPGEVAPEDGAGPQPVRNGDAANLALWLMGYPPIEGALHAGMRITMPSCEPTPSSPPGQSTGGASAEPTTAGAGP